MLSLHAVAVGPGKSEAFDIACGRFFLTTPGAVTGLNVILEHAIELAVHGYVEVDEEVIGRVGAIEPIIDSDEHPAILDEHPAMLLACHALRPLHIAVWRQALVPIAEGDLYRLSRFMWPAAIAWRPEPEFGDSLDEEP